MSQVASYTISNLAGAAFRAAVNVVTAAIRTMNSGNTAPTETAPYMLWVDTVSGVIMRRNSADSAWVLHDSAASNMTDAKSAAYTAVKGDHKRFIRFTGSGGFTLSLTAAATLGEGWTVLLRNDSTGTITIDPNGTEQIDGAATLSLLAGQSCWVVCTGAAHYTLSLSGGGSLTDTARIDIASAATLDLTAAGPAATRNINITGTTGITGVTVAVGRLYFVRFAASLVLTNGAGLVTNTGGNITTQAGDTCIFRATAANTIEVLCYVRAGQFSVLATVATTSGTTVSATGLPAGLKRLQAHMLGVSTSGTSGVQLRAGTSGGLVATGYAGSNGVHDASALNAQLLSTGFNFTPNASNAAAATWRGMIELVRVDEANGIWSASGVLSRSDSAYVAIVSGSIQLSGVLDRVALTTVGGTDTFDAGSFVLMGEF